MPLYEYYCAHCHGVFELLRPAREASDPKPCPECDRDCARIVSSFQPFTFRDGYPRKLPDNGGYWHREQRVSAPVSGAVTPSRHPELTYEDDHVPPPSPEEIDRAETVAGAYIEKQRLGGAREAHVERELTDFAGRMAAGAEETRAKRRRQPNARTTARTTSGQHDRPEGAARPAPARRAAPARRKRR